MKISWIFALGFFVVAVISCQCLRTQSGRTTVQIEEHSVLIPGTAISGPDQEALNRIFKKYDSSLYRIAVYENGSWKKQIGKMDEMQMAEITKDYTRNAASSGLSSWTSQLGLRTHVTLFPPTTHVIRPGNTTHVTRTATGQPTHVTTGEPTHVTTGELTHVTHHGFPSIDEESDALVKEVTPILEKYSK